MIGRDLIDIIIQPVRKQQVGMSAPMDNRLSRRIISREEVAVPTEDRASLKRVSMDTGVLLPLQA